MSKPKNILILNVHSTLNAGDAALLYSNIQQLEKVFSDAQYTALVNYPNEIFFTQLSNVNIIPSPFALAGSGSELPDWKKILKLTSGCIMLLLAKVLPRKVLDKNPSDWFRMALVYRRADVVAAVSGAQLVSLGKFSWPLIVSSVSLIFTHYFRKPLYVMPQSIGPFRWKWEKWLVRENYSRARLVFLRDNISMQLAKDIKLPESKIRFAFDPGFALPAASVENALEIMSEYEYTSGQSAIGITVIGLLSKTYDPDKFTKYYRTLANILSRFSKTYNAKIFIFDQVRGPTTKEDDSIAVEALLDMVSENRDRIIHVNKQLSPMELKACYGMMDMFIASRFHSGIFAMSSGVPTLFVGYNPKTKGFLSAVGLDQLMVDLNEIEENQFWNLICQTWENRQEIAAKTRAIVKDCQKDFERVSQLISEDYFDGKGT